MCSTKIVGWVPPPPSRPSHSATHLYSSTLLQPVPDEKPNVLGTIDVVNLATGETMQGPLLPDIGTRSCAVEHEGFIYWIHTPITDGLMGPAKAVLYRAQGKRCGCCLSRTPP